MTLTGAAIPPNQPSCFSPVDQRCTNQPTVKVSGPSTGCYVVMCPKDGTMNVPPVRRR